MADICMCQDKRCPSRTLCYRFTAEADPYRQAYWAKSPRKPNAMRCKEFWDNKGTPDPTDDSVSTYKAKECRCNAYAMPHKWNHVCLLYEIMHENVRNRKQRDIKKKQLKASELLKHIRKCSKQLKQHQQTKD